MAITFDPATKIIQLDSHTVSERELWTAMVNWAVLSDNLKYGIGMTQLGGVAPIALYVYLELGWKIRPLEENGITTVTGNVLVQGGGSPIASTIGNYNILVNMETPVKSSAIEVISGSGLSTEEHNRLMSPNIEGISSVDFHSNLDSYTNKDDWKGDGGSGGGFTDDDRTDLAAIKDDVNLIKDYQEGKYKIIGNQMIFYKADNVTEVARFNLYNDAGVPAMENVFERRKV